MNIVQRLAFIEYDCDLYEWNLMHVHWVGYDDHEEPILSSSSKENALVYFQQLVSNRESKAF